LMYTQTPHTLAYLLHGLVCGLRNERRCHDETRRCDQLAGGQPWTGGAAARRAAAAASWHASRRCYPCAGCLRVIVASKHRSASGCGPHSHCRASGSQIRLQMTRLLWRDNLTLRGSSASHSGRGCATDHLHTGRTMLPFWALCIAWRTLGGFAPTIDGLNERLNEQNNKKQSPLRTMVSPLRMRAASSPHHRQ
jgi:hypothetical protein